MARGHSGDCGSAGLGDVAAIGDREDFSRGAVEEDDESLVRRQARGGVVEWMDFMAFGTEKFRYHLKHRDFVIYQQEQLSFS